ncbi:MAG: hypothetical protein LBJ75_01060 [Puniceicoccales bacterium]|jgi:hypothetical protein|nr:hypothetical protein [Puniceicoccales bacterium]
MSDEVTVNASGYAITQEAIAGVANPFLDLAKALGTQFYFLEGQYDQIVLEKIYTILYSVDAQSRDDVAAAEEALEEAREAYAKAAADLGPFQELGAFEFEGLVEKMNSYTMDEDGIFPKDSKATIDTAYNEVVKLICDISNELIDNYYSSNSLPAPAFHEDTALVTLKTTLGVDSRLTALNTALVTAAGGLADGDKKNNINAAIAAITTYTGSKTDGNLDNVKDKLNTIKNYTEVATAPSVTQTISVIGAVRAISTYTGGKTDANLKAVQTVLTDAANSYLNGITGVTAMKDSLTAYLGLKDKLTAANTAIATFKGTKTKANLDDVITKLSAIQAVLGGTTFPSTLKETGKWKDLFDSVNLTIEQTSDTRAKLTDLDAAITDYNGATSLTTSPALFWEVERAFRAFDGVHKRFPTLTTLNLETRAGGCETKIKEVFTKFDDFYNSLEGLLKICNTSTAKTLLSSAAQDIYYEGSSLKEPLKRDALFNASNLVSGALATMLNDLAGQKKAVDDRLAELNGLIPGYDPNASEDELFNLCMMASTPKPQANGTYRLVTGITRTIDKESGNFSYALKYDNTKTISQAEYEASFSKEDGYMHFSLPYLALAIMYEKVGIQQLVLVEQLKQVEKLNDAIKESNKALKLLSWIYDKVYAQASVEANHGSAHLKNDDIPAGVDMTFGELDDFLEHTVGAGNLGRSGGTTPYEWNESTFRFEYSHYNRDGNTPSSGGGKDAKDNPTTTQNIDVTEQATLTMLSNRQDSTRIYSDQLSTDSQLMTTKMSQYMQNSNACVSACTQVLKSVGEFNKTTASNAR